MWKIQPRTASAALNFATVCLLAFALSGCGKRTVYVPSGEPVRLRTTLHKVPVWVADKDGKEIPGEMDLPEGWYSLYDPGAGPTPDGKTPPEVPKR